MKNFFRKTLYRAFSLTVIVALMAGFFPNWIQTAQATAYLAGSMSDIMTTLKDNTVSDHTIQWELPATIDFDSAGNTDYMRVDFPAAFVTGGAAWTTADFTLFVDDGVRELTVQAVEEGVGDIECAVTDGANNVCISVDTTNEIFTIKPSATFTATTAGQYMVLTIDGTAGNGTLTNPDIVIETDYVVALAMCDEAADCATWGTESHTGSLAVDIIPDDQVVVSAIVEPSITFTLSGNTANLGTLSAAAINHASISVRTVTNASGGYSTTVFEDGELRSGANTINDVAGGSVNLGSEEYGLSTTDDGQYFTEDDDVDCGTPPNPKPALAIDGTARSVAGEIAGPNIDETRLLCFVASINGTTVAATYQHTLTFVSTATF